MLRPPSADRKPTRRVEGLDVARGLVGFDMVFGHAFDAWVSPSGKETTAYAVKRFLGTFPLPTFLTLAGIVVAWRLASAIRKGEPADQVRRGLVRRGLQILGTGYAANAVYAVLDGGRDLDVVLRADVLHVIGLSIAFFAAVGIRGRRDDGLPDLDHLTRVGAAVGVAVVLASPWVNRWSLEVTGPARFVVAPFAEVPGGAGRMPLFPLAGWLAGGFVVGRSMLAGRRYLPAGFPLPRAGTSRRLLLLLFGIGAIGAVAGHLGAEAMVAVMGGPFDRRHPAIWLNVVDLGGRALALVAAACLVSNHLRGRLRWALLTMGRNSLTAYVFHIPFAYGRFGRPFQGALGVGEAMVGVLALWAATMVAVVTWPRLRGWLGAGLIGRRERSLSARTATTDGGSAKSAIHPHRRER